MASLNALLVVGFLWYSRQHYWSTLEDAINKLLSPESGAHLHQHQLFHTLIWVFPGSRPFFFSLSVSSLLLNLPRWVTQMCNDKGHHSPITWSKQGSQVNPDSKRKEKEKQAFHGPHQMEMLGLLKLNQLLACTTSLMQNSFKRGW